MFETKVVEKIRTHILCSIFFSFENDAVYEIMWKNMVERGRPGDDHIIRCIRIACCVTTAINMHSECLILIAFPLEQWLRERASMLRYRCIACLVLCLHAIVVRLLC
jgi:hypothetical protein